MAQTVSAVEPPVVGPAVGRPLLQTTNPHILSMLVNAAADRRRPILSPLGLRGNAPVDAQPSPTISANQPPPSHTLVHTSPPPSHTLVHTSPPPSHTLVHTSPPPSHTL
eukprot:Selendium_serpulae@DN1963_c1_g1_i1.p1